MKNAPACGRQASAPLPSFFVIAAYVKVHLISQNFACLRVAASAKAGAPCIWAFLISPETITFSEDRKKQKKEQSDTF
jgi:hypothetical protein